LVWNQSCTSTINHISNLLKKFYATIYLALFTSFSGFISYFRDCVSFFSASHTIYFYQANCNVVHDLK